MKKALLFMTVLCMAGVFSAKAQSPSDSAYARDLSYTFFNMSSLPNTVTGDLNTGSKILKDIRVGNRACGYAITVTQNTTLDMQLLSGGSYKSQNEMYKKVGQFVPVLKRNVHF